MRAVGRWARLALPLFLLAGGCAGPSAGLQGRIEPTGDRSAHPPLENTVVYLVGPAPETPAPAPGLAYLTEDERGLHPSVLAVASGTKVVFRNHDNVFHKLFSISPTQPFEMDPVAPGESRSVVFDHSGAIQVFCELHPEESAYIYVVPTSHFARADAEGRFHFAAVSAGTYTLHTWHPDRGQTSQAVVVPKHGQVRVTVTD